MYTTRKSPIAKLRAYHRGLCRQYRDAIARGRIQDAIEIRERRRRVLRAILIHEEWLGDPDGAETAH